MQTCSRPMFSLETYTDIQRTERSPEVANECLMSIFGHASSSPQNAKNVNWLIMKYVSSLLW